MSVEASDHIFLVPITRAQRMAKAIIQAEARPGRDPDDVANAVERRWGISFWQVIHLAKGRAKKCDIALFGRVRAAYLALCEREFGKLEGEIDLLREEISIDKAIDDVDLEDLEARARALAQEIQARKAELKRMPR